MHWVFSHPYTAALAGAGILLLLGGLVVVQKAPVDPAGTTYGAWSGGGLDLSYPDSNIPPPQINQGANNLYSEVQNGPPFYYSTIPQSQIPLAEMDDAEFDFAALLGMLSEQPSSSQTSIAAEEGVDAYSFIPSGLISVTSSTETRTATQQALYDYGNEVGSSIETYENAYRNAPQILKDQFEDREDAAKNDTLLQLAEAMGRVGENMLAMERVPESVASAHMRLAKSYQEMSGLLSKIPGVQGDQALVQAMLTYNAAVETFTKNFVALATLFSIHGVKFTGSDPGSVFTFSAVSF